ncbi:MAG TPA: group 1 truncated hemoglobin [Polyangiaceae bacterium]|nr:group 1 truncated hemoglobin [Polyangiaceae bacterium]
MQATLFDQLGGEPVLRAIIDRFVDRVVSDTMIGFFFARVNKERLKQLEYEFAAEHLGANIVYSGRPIQQAHQRHAIMGGQFRRRLVLLQETLAEFGVPENIVAHWVAHTLALEGSVTPDADGRCIARHEDTRES